MSYAIDVNILLYASDSSSEYHEAAAGFLKRQSDLPEIMYLAYATLVSYLRMATHPRIFRAPLSPQKALANLESLTHMPNVRLIGEDSDFLSTYRKTTSTFPVRGNLVPDAHLATLLYQHDIRVLYTNDSDFRKFTFLDVRNPFE